MRSFLYSHINLTSILQLGLGAAEVDGLAGLLVDTVTNNVDTIVLPLISGPPILAVFLVHAFLMFHHKLNSPFEIGNQGGRPSPLFVVVEVRIVLENFIQQKTETSPASAQNSPIASLVSVL